MQEDKFLEKIHKEWESAQSPEVNPVNIDELTEEDQSLFVKVKNTVTLDSVILSKENEAQISQFLNELKFSNMFREFNLEVINRMLFWGASGCGKTYLAEALSTEIGYPLLYINIKSVYTKGDIASKLTRVFEIAGNHNCIIFLDECDTIAWNRKETRSKGSDTSIALNHLFVLLDNMSANTIVIAATNMQSHLDAAFLTRFTKSLEFKKPLNNIAESVNKFIKDGFIFKVNISQVTSNGINSMVADTKGFSYRELVDIVNMAMKRSLMNNTNVVLFSDIVQDILYRIKRKLKIEVLND